METKRTRMQINQIKNNKQNNNNKQKIINRDNQQNQRLDFLKDRQH